MIAKTAGLPTTKKNRVGGMTLHRPRLQARPAGLEPTTLGLEGRRTLRAALTAAESRFSPRPVSEALPSGHGAAASAPMICGAGVLPQIRHSERLALALHRPLIRA